MNPRLDLRRHPVIGLALLAVAMLLAAGPGTAETAPKPDARTGLRAERWLADARHLSSGSMKGRGNGKPELNKAAEYIAREFDRAGLKPLPGGWYQPFPVVVGANLGKRNKLAMVQPDRQSYRLKRDFTPLGFSGTAEFTTGVVFVGYGIVAPEYNYDDYGQLDVRGKVVLALRHEPQENNDSSVFRGRRLTRHADIISKAVIARNRGAAALIFVTDPGNHDADEDTLLPFTAVGDPGGAGVPVIQVRQHVAEGWMRSAGKSLRELQAAIDKDLSNQSFALPETLQLQVSTEVFKRQATLKNVVGILPGQDPKLRDEIIVLGAHYDHLGPGDYGSMAPQLYGQIHHGADDNASGTAGLIELARLFSAERGNRRSVLFMAYAGEEMGLLGSAYYVENPLLPLNRKVAMLNLDMIGRAKENKLFMGGVGTSPDFRRIVAEENESSAGGPAPGFSIDYNDSGYDASDHMSFARKNIPVMFFFTGLHADYHRPSDTWDRLVPEAAIRVLDLTARITRRIDSEDDRPLYTQVERPQRGPGGRGDGGEPSSGYGVFFGSIPDMARSSDGVRFDGVVPGSPADKAGIKAGDILIQFDGEQVKNLHEFSSFLAGRKAGDTVLVIVNRNGQELPFKVMLVERR